MSIASPTMRGGTAPNGQAVSRNGEARLASSAAPLRAAVIGSGKISEEHLRFLGNSPLVSLVGVCDLSPSLAKYAVARFGNRKGTPTVPFTDYQQMLREAKPDVVHVLTPANTHGRLVTDCLNAGCHVVVEKPAAPTNAEFRQLWEVAKANNRHLIEDHNYRFNEPVRAIERLVRQGKLGEVREAEVRMVLAIREPGGRFTDAALPHPSHALPAGIIHEFITHYCYLVQRFVPDFGTVRAAWRKHGTDTVIKYDDLDALILSGPAHARIRFSSDAAPDCFTLTVRGTRGWAETDLFQPHLRVVVPRKGSKQLSPLINQFVNGVGLARASVVGFKNKVMQKTPYEGLGTFLRETYSALQRGEPPPVTFEDMDRASRLADAMLAAENRM